MWYNPNWLYRIKITVPAKSVSLSNFALYLDLSELPSSFHTNVKSDGSDIRVTASDGETEVPRELIYYNSGSGALYFKGSVSDSAATDFYIYYGNAAAGDYAINATYGAQNVWTSDVLAVWHFQEDPSGAAPQIIDSTSNNLDGTTAGSMTSGDLVDGLNGKALDFDGSNDYVDLGNSTFLDNKTSVTFRTRIKFQSLGPDRAILRRWRAGQQAYIFGMHSGTGNELQIAIRDGSNVLIARTTNASLTTGVWYTLTFVWSGGNSYAFYKDGVLLSATADSSSNPAAINSVSERVAIGARYNNGSEDLHINAIIDEIKMYDRSVSSAEESIFVDNEDNSGAFFTIGTQEANAALWQAQGNGEVTDDGGGTITRRGFVVSTTTISDPGDVDPDTLGITVVDESGTYGEVAFDLLVTGLDPDTTYYLRAFAENSAGFSYGGQVTFTTEAALAEFDPLVAALGTFSLAGIAVDLLINRQIAANQGEYTLTGRTAAFRRHYRLAANSGAFALTGSTAAFPLSRKLTLELGSFALTGYQTGASTDRLMIASKGTYTFIGSPVALRVNRIMAAEQGAYVYTGQPTAVRRAYTIALEAAVFALSGQDVSLLRNRYIAPDTGAYGLTGQDAGLLWSRIFTVDAGSFAVAGNDTGIRANRSLSLIKGTFSLNGTSAFFIVGAQLVARDGSYSLSGSDVGLTVTRTMALDSGQFAYTGNDVTFDYGITLNLETGTYTFTGTDVGLVKTSRLYPGSGGFNIDGNAANQRRTSFLATEPGTFTFAGIDTDLYRRFQVPLAAGSYALEGTDTNVLKLNMIDLGAGIYDLIGFDAALVRFKGCRPLLTPKPAAFTDRDPILEHQPSSLSAKCH